MRCRLTATSLSGTCWCVCIYIRVVCVHGRTGFSCKTCTRLRKQRSDATTRLLKEEISHYIRLHLQQSREAREAYADHIYTATTIREVASWAIDAADQAKHHCPLLTCPGVNVGLKRRIVQQFIGVLDHSVGYFLYRRLPVVKKGANVNLTILIDMIANGHLKGMKRLLLQWDGASENVNYTNIRFCV